MRLGPWLLPIFCGAFACSKSLPQTEDDRRDVTDEVVEDTRLLVQIMSPDSDAHHYVSERVDLLVQVEDGESKYDDIELRWNSDLDGELDVFMDHSGEGTFSGSTRHLSIGDHLLRVTATDSDGNTDTEQVVVDVGPENTPPTCSIVYPTEGSVGFPGEMVTLTAEISDPDVASTYLTAEWASTIQGPLGNSAVSTDGRSVLPVENLESGTHTIQLIARDEKGGMCTDLVVYQVGSGPEVQIISPADGAIVDEGAPVEFLATALDSVDSPGDLTITWRSDSDGLLNDVSPDFDGTMEFQIDDLSRGHHTVTLRAINSAGMGNDDTVTLTVNGVPTQPEIEIIPADPMSSEALTARITLESTDPDGDPIDYRYTWTQNGSVVLDGETSVVSADATEKGDVWRLTVTPSDSLGSNGTPAEAEVIIGNSPPQMLSVTLTPDPADTTDDFFCTYTGLTDWDGDEVSVVTAWYVDDELLPVTTSELDKSWSSRGESVYCEVTPHDGFVSGETLRSNVVTVENSAPYALAVFIDPDAVRAGDRPACIHLGFNDPDGDEDASTVAWRVNGVLSSVGYYADGDFYRGDTLTCTVTPSDGTAEGSPISTSVTVLNSAPSYARVEMTPLPASVGETIHCNAWGFYDPDGDDDFSEITWDINGGVYGVSSSLTGGFAGGDTVSCTVVPNDGYDEGEAITRTQTIGNSPPAIGLVSISPASPTVDDTLHCTYTDWYDADGDPDLSTYRWLVNGFDSGESGAYLYGGFSSADAVTCQVTPFDGWSEGETRSATVEIENTAPSISFGQFAPTVVGTSDMLTVEVISFDGDGDLVDHQYQWRVDGEPAGTDSPMLDGVYWFDKGQSVEVDVTPYDAHAVGEAYTVGPLIVGNTAPEGLDISVTPEHPDAGSHDLTCVLEVEASDPDGDGVDYVVHWMRDGVPFTATDTMVLPGDTVPAEYPESGEIWTCEVTASDDDGASVSDSQSVFIAGWTGRTEEEPAVSCAHVRSVYPSASDGVYYLQPVDDVFEAYCDMTTDGGGWTLVAFAPMNYGAPEAFFDGSSHDRGACPLMTAFCRLSDDEINAILEWGSGTDDRLRLFAPGTPAHHKYYWNTTLHFSTISFPGVNAWWAVATEYGGTHSPGCPVDDARSVGHSPTAMGCTGSSTFGPGVTDRIFFASTDGAFVGSSTDSTFSWYAK